jgi:glucuronosyltransferase
MPSSFVPSAMLPFRDEMTFMERLINFFINNILVLVMPLAMGGKSEAVYRKELGEDLPSLAELQRNASMMFTNSHFTQTFPRPLLPDVIEIGGMHCQPAKALPKDLQEFADGAKDGLILFSLGSIIQGNQMPDSTRKVFLNVFSRLKQRVIWKWETESMPNLPPNVRLSKWVPQQDILGHPNLKIFMTHGGLLSTQESIYHGATLLAIPIFGDQNLNAMQAEQGGFALTLEILDVTEEDLESKIKELLENKKYSENAKLLSKVFRDQPETPVERAVFWSEYLMRHKGARHLRSAARKLNMIQYHSIDVFAFLASLAVLILWIAKLAIFKIFKMIFRGKAKSSVKKDQ